MPNFESQGQNVPPPVAEQTPEAKTPPNLEDLVEKARQESEAREGKEFDPEAEKEKIYAHANERRSKVYEFRRQVFEKAGKDLEANGYKSGIHNGILHSPAEYAAFENANLEAVKKTYFAKKKDDKAGLTYEEKASLLYSRKLGEIEEDMRSQIEALEERVKASSKTEQPKPEESKPKEPNAEKPKIEDLEKMMGEI